MTGHIMAPAEPQTAVERPLTADTHSAVTFAVDKQPAEQRDSSGEASDSHADLRASVLTSNVNAGTPVAQQLHELDLTAGVESPSGAEAQRSSTPAAVLQPAKSTQSAELTQAAGPAELTQAAKPTQPDALAQAAGLAVAMEPTQPTELDEAAEPARPHEFTESAEVAEAAELTHLLSQPDILSAKTGDGCVDMVTNNIETVPGTMTTADAAASALPVAKVGFHFMHTTSCIHCDEGAIQLCSAVPDIHLIAMS